MTLLQGLSLYPHAILWSALISSLCAMEGYDISLIGNFYAFPPFNRQFGVLGSEGYQVPAGWQTGLSCGAQSGQIVGLISEYISLMIDGDQAYSASQWIPHRTDRVPESHLDLLALAHRHHCSLLPSGESEDATGG